MGRRRPPIERDLPFTYWVFGRPVSTRNEADERPAGFAKWRGSVSTAVAEMVESVSKGRGLILTDRPVEARIYWLSNDLSDSSHPDVDNILKPLIDALNQTVIEDDQKIYRILAEKALINSPPKGIEDVMKEIQNDGRYVEVGEVVVVQLLDFNPEYEP